MRAKKNENEKEEKLSQDKREIIFHKESQLYYNFVFGVCERKQFVRDCDLVFFQKQKAFTKLKVDNEFCD